MAALIQNPAYAEWRLKSAFPKIKCKTNDCRGKDDDRCMSFIASKAKWMCIYCGTHHNVNGTISRKTNE